MGRHSGRRTGRGGPCGVREGLFGRPGSLPACVTRAGLAAVWAVCGLVAVGDIVLVYGPTHHSRPTGPRGASSFAVKGLCHRSESPKPCDHPRRRARVVCQMRRRRGGRRRGRQRRHPSPYGCPRARLGDQGRGPSRECSAGASFWVHGTAAGPIREPLRTRSLDGLVGGRCSTTKAPDAAAKGPPTAPGLVVGVGCASRGGEAA